MRGFGWVKKVTGGRATPKPATVPAEAHSENTTAREVAHEPPARKEVGDMLDPLIAATRGTTMDGTPRNEGSIRWDAFTLSTGQSGYMWYAPTANVLVFIAPSDHNYPAPDPGAPARLALYTPDEMYLDATVDARVNVLCELAASQAELARQVLDSILRDLDELANSAHQVA
jgi:hypothetical protein